MNAHMTRSEFEALPFRDDVSGDYDPAQLYRAKRYSALVFKWTGDRHHPKWDAFGVVFEDVRT